LIKRVITGTCVALVMLAGVLLQGWPMLCLIGICMFIGTSEIYKAVRATGSEPVCWAGYVYCALAIAAQAVRLLLHTEVDFTMAALLAGVMAAVTHLVSRGKIAMESLVTTLFPMLYPGIFFVALMELLQFDNRAAVVVALVLAFFAASVNDVFALFSGLLFGKHKLSPELSPKKTIEGSIGGLAASTLFSMAVPGLLRVIFKADAGFMAGLEALPPVWAFALLGLLAGAFSQIGDLIASMVKRHCGVKDYGKLLPGHGGIMDRLDGVLFCGAACYIFFKISGIG